MYKKLMNLLQYGPNYCIFVISSVTKTETIIVHQKKKQKTNGSSE